MTSQDKNTDSLIERCRSMLRSGARRALYPLSDRKPVNVHTLRHEERIRANGTRNELDHFTGETVPSAEGQIVHWSVNEQLYTHLLSHRIL